MQKLKPTPEPTIRRLPKYLQMLKAFEEQENSTISCTRIAKELELDATQVRKDIEITGIVGKPKTGYSVKELVHAIREHLNWNNARDAFLAGAGNLGAAILGYERFKQYGMNIIAAFDADEAKINTEIFGVKVLDIHKMTELAQRMHIHIGIITVPAEHAQRVADEMILGGIKAIWNFAPVKITVPSNIIIENAQLSLSLAVLSRKLKETDLIENS